MKWRFRIIAIAVLTLLSASRSAVGQKTLTLGIGGGAAIPVGKLSDTQNTGYSALVVLAMGAAELPIGVRFDGIYSTLLNNKLLSPGGAAISSDLRVIGGLGNLIFAFPGTSAKPYVIVGGGLYNTKADVPGAKAGNDFGFNAGFGATFGIGPFATFLETRYHTISRKAAEGGVIQFVPVTIGLLF